MQLRSGRLCSTSVDKPSIAAGPSPDTAWTVAAVQFNAPEFGKDHKDIHTWEWWLRFRCRPDWTRCDLKDRVREIVRAQYSPPMSHQTGCDLCCDSRRRRKLYYELKDEDFLAIMFMPSDMDTSDDDVDAAAGAKDTITACTRMRASRKQQEIRTARQRTELDETASAHDQAVLDLKACHAAESVIGRLVDTI